ETNVPNWRGPMQLRRKDSFPWFVSEWAGRRKRTGRGGGRQPKHQTRPLAPLLGTDAGADLPETLPDRAARGREDRATTVAGRLLPRAADRQQSKGKFFPAVFRPAPPRTAEPRDFGRTVSGAGAAVAAHGPPGRRPRRRPAAGRPVPGKPSSGGQVTAQAR